MRTVSLLEHESIPVGDKLTGKRLTIAEAEALEKAQRSIGITAFRWMGRNRIKAAQYVGIIVTPSIRLEILPKIESLNQENTRAALLPMLAAAWDLPIYDDEITGYKCQNRDLLEIIISIFARRLQNEVRKGLSHSYQQHSGDLAVLRGKLNVTRQFTEFAANPQFLACYYDEFSANNSLNQLLLCTLLFLRHRSNHIDTQRLLSEIEAHFEDVETLPPQIALFQKISLNRTNKNWDVLVRFARVLLSSHYQTTHSGTRDGIALLFDMNRLFESYIACVAQRTLTKKGYKVYVQRPQRYLAKDTNGKHAFMTKPDLYIEHGDKKMVLDTKWKFVDQTNTNFGVTQADAYQMHGYAHIYKAQSTVLIYPHHANLTTPAGIMGNWAFEAGGCNLTILTVDVSKPSQVKEAVCSVV